MYSIFDLLLLTLIFILLIFILLTKKIYKIFEERYIILEDRNHLGHNIDYTTRCSRCTFLHDDHLSDHSHLIE
jgi:hypothetical protein